MVGSPLGRGNLGALIRAMSGLRLSIWEDGDDDGRLVVKAERESYEIE